MTIFLARYRLCTAVIIAFAFVGPFGSVRAQQYPAQDIRFICAFPPGSGSDVLVRYFAEKIRPLAGRNILVENRSGAAGNIAMEYAARSKPDGYTIYIHAASSAAASMHLFKKPPVDVLSQLSIAGTINRQPYMVVVDAASSAKTLADLSAILKEKGNKASYGAPSFIATVVAEIYKTRLALEPLEVNYKMAADTLNDLASGTLDFVVADPVFSLAQAKAGRVRILGVTTDSRLNAARDLPTMAEQGVPMNITGWWAAMVPAGVPKSVVQQINGWFSQVVGTEETKLFLAQSGGDPLIETPEQAQERFAKDVENWAEWIRAARISPQ